MCNAIAVFITCNAIHATAISLPLSLLSGRLRSRSPKSARHLQTKFTATCIRSDRFRPKYLFPNLDFPSKKISTTIIIAESREIKNESSSHGEKLFFQKLKLRAKNAQYLVCDHPQFVLSHSFRAYIHIYQRVNCI